MATPFENFVNTELPKRIATNVSPTAPTAGQIPVFTGVGLLIENKNPNELNLGNKQDLVQVAASGTVTIAANKSYLILATGNFTLNADALSTGHVIEVKSLLDSVTASLTVTFGGISSYFSELGGSAGSALVYPASTILLSKKTAGIYYRRTGVQFAAEFMLRKDGNSSLRSTFDNSAITNNRVITLPDATFDLGDLSFVAKTSGNTLSGTRCRILGGSNNTVSGTDNVVIGCSDNTRASGSGRAVIILANRFNTSAVAALAPHSIVLGTSEFDPNFTVGGPYNFAGAVKAQTALCTQPVTASGSAYSLTTDGQNPTYTNCLPALLYANTFMSARHEFDIIITFGEDFVILPSRTFYAKRTVYVARRITSPIPLNVTPVLEMSIATPQPDVTLGLGSNTVTIDFTLDAAGNRLIPTVAVTSNPSYQRMQVSCRVDSHYNCK